MADLTSLSTVDEAFIQFLDLSCFYCFPALVSGSRDHRHGWPLELSTAYWDQHNPKPIASRQLKYLYCSGRLSWLLNLLLYAQITTSRNSAGIPFAYPDYHTGLVVMVGTLFRGFHLLFYFNLVPCCLFLFRLWVWKFEFLDNSFSNLFFWTADRILAFSCLSSHPVFAFEKPDLIREPVYRLHLKRRTFRQLTLGCSIWL